MIAATGVSRTVVREAVAALRADGLVVTRQGVGAFVAEQVRRPFRIEFDENSSLQRRARDIGIAHRHRDRGGRALPPSAPRPRSSRRSASASTRSKRAIAARRDRGRRGLRVPLRDRRRHRQSAVQAVPRISRPLHHPAARRCGAATRRCSARAAFATFQREHREILDAIRARSVKRARGAMQSHLANSRRRYQKLRLGARANSATHSRHRRGGRHRHAPAQIAQGRLSAHPLERHQAAGRSRQPTKNSSRPTFPTTPRSRSSPRASTASSISAAIRSKGRGRRSSPPTSSAAATCSRRRTATASSASCSRRPTMRSASIRAARRSASTSRCGRTHAMA